MQLVVEPEAAAATVRLVEWAVAVVRLEQAAAAVVEPRSLRLDLLGLQATADREIMRLGRVAAQQADLVVWPLGLEKQLRALSARLNLRALLWVERLG